MVNRYHLLGAAACLAACAAAAPAAAAVVVVGNSDARMCYQAADSPMMPAARDVRRCDHALLREALSGYEVVATHVNRGILRLRRGMIDDAIADFDRAIMLDPNQPEAYLNKGAALLRRENAAEALTLFSSALDRNTSRPAIAHYGRAIANETLGNLNAAYRDYSTASRIDPEWREPRLELARFRVVAR
ncbi:MAG TPA: tetratricopeptide repeat protein [Allosphingosinicella sp.]|nr:tetratricopeptide repeat protein [Allosphingosinicella sp.]